MNDEPRFFENAKMIFVGNQTVSYGAGSRKEKIIILYFSDKEVSVKVIVSRLKGVRNIDEKLVQQYYHIKAEVEPVKHKGEENLWLATRLLLLDKTGEAKMVFT